MPQAISIGGGRISVIDAEGATIAAIAGFDCLCHYRSRGRPRRQPGYTSDCAGRAPTINTMPVWSA